MSVRASAQSAGATTAAARGSSSLFLGMCPALLLQRWRSSSPIAAPGSFSWKRRQRGSPLPQASHRHDLCVPRGGGQSPAGCTREADGASTPPRPHAPQCGCRRDPGGSGSRARSSHRSQGGEGRACRVGGSEPAGREPQGQPHVGDGGRQVRRAPRVRCALKTGGGGLCRRSSGH